MAANGPFYTNGKRGSAPHASSGAPAEGTFKWRLAGPQTHVIIRENRADVVKIPIQRRVLLNWSQAGRDQLAARSREKADFGAKTLVLEDWANEEGVKWLLDWMNEKCKAEDEDDHLRTKQQAEERGHKMKRGVRVPDGDDFILMMKLHQAAQAIQLPNAINHISEAVFGTIKQRPMDAAEMEVFWSLFGQGPPRLNLHRALDAQVEHMMSGTPGDYEAIQSIAEREENYDLNMLLYEKCNGIWKKNGGPDTASTDNQQSVRRRDSALQSSSDTEPAA